MRFLVNVVFSCLYIGCILATLVSCAYLTDVFVGDFSSLPYSLVIFVFSLYIGGWMIQKIDFEWHPIRWLSFIGILIEYAYIYFYITINFIILKMKGYSGTYRECKNKFFPDKEN